MQLVTFSSLALSSEKEPSFINKKGDSVFLLLASVWHAVTSAARAVRLGAGQDGVAEEVLWAGCSEAPQFTAVGVGWWVWTVVFGHSCSVNPCLGLQAAKSQSVGTWQTLTAEDTLSHHVCSPLHLFIQETYDTNGMCVCERGRVQACPVF